MGESNTNSFKLLPLIAGIGGIIILVILTFVIINNISPILDEYNSTSEVILTESTFTLANSDVSSLITTSYNDTFLNFTDTSSDYVISNRYDTISFWYKNSTTDWTFIVNSSGTLYVNGVAGTPEVYPIYDNTTHMLIGQIDAVTFFNGSIDDFRGYNSSIEPQLVNLTYLGGRL